MAARKPAATTVAHASFNEAFHAAQQEMPAIQRDAVNPHLRNKYASLASIIPTVLEVAGKHGLTIMQMPSHIDGAPAVRTVIRHVASGEFDEATTPIPTGGKDTGHSYGSGITYMRRYAITAAFGLVTENDDDGNAVTPGVGSGALSSQPAGPPAAPASTGDVEFGASL